MCVLRRAPAGEPAQALGDGVTDVTLPCCMCVGAFVLSCACLCLQENKILGARQNTGGFFSYADGDVTRRGRNSDLVGIP